MKTMLLEQFTNCYDQNGWFVALKNALDGVTAEQAAWKPDGTQNSIWEIVSHLNFYNYAYVERFKGVDYQYPTDNNDATFVADEQASGEAWAAEVERLNSILTEFRALIRGADESRFGQSVSAANPASWGTLIANINVHNAHHGGQIVLLRKLQGIWDPRKGVS